MGGTGKYFKGNLRAERQITYAFSHMWVPQQLLIVKYEYVGGSKCGQMTGNQKMTEDGKKEALREGIEEAIEHMG